MRRALAALFAPGAAVLAPASALGAQTFLTEADAPKAIFPESTRAAKKTLELSDAEADQVGRGLGRRLASKAYPYLEVAGPHGDLGAVFMLDVLGQNEPITFAVGVDAKGELKDLQVMVYREAHGEAIEEKRFRRQFVGKKLADPIALGKDIDAVSGATISSRSATFAARKGLALAQVLQQRAARR